MPRPAIPHRIPPLRWRGPAVLWTPLALAIAIGWPAAMFYNNAGLQRLALIGGALVFALALVSLGVSWATGRAPRSRRIIVLHVIVAGVIVALLAPFALAQLLALVADDEHTGAGANFTFAMSLAMTPLALVIGLPVFLLSGMLFSWIALVRPLVDEPEQIARNDVQPFR